jgi:hypothetical protein
MQSQIFQFKNFWLLLALCCVSPVAIAENADPIVRIEEEWELRVETPDRELDAPQIVMAFSPLGDISGLHATFELNHISSVLYAPGGLHLSVWNGETHLSVCHAGNYAIMSDEGETVRWTQVIQKQEDNLTFKIINGDSETWGVFGGNDELALAVSMDGVDFTNYSPAVSVQESNVSYAGNRVRSLTLRKVKYIKASGDVTEDNTERVAHSSADSSND